MSVPTLEYVSIVTVDLIRKKLIKVWSEQATSPHVGVLAGRIIGYGELYLIKLAQLQNVSLDPSMDQLELRKQIYAYEIYAG